MNDLLILGTNEGVVVARQEEDLWELMSRTLRARQVNSLSVQGGVILAGTTEGVFRSENLGETWHMASDGLSVPKVRWVTHDPSRSGTVLAGTEPAAIFVSRDGGRQWRECPEVAALREEHGWYLPYSPEAGCVRGFAFHGDRVYAAVEQGGLLRSDDRGATWRLAGGSNGIPRTPPEGFIHPDVHSVAVHVSSPDLVLAPTGGGLYVSKDGGERWTQWYRCYCRAIWPDPAHVGRMIFGPADSVDRQGRIEETDDGGETWHLASDGLNVPWAQHMVERFWQVDYRLLAVLSNGDVVVAPLQTLSWQHMLPGAGWVRAIATMRRSEGGHA